MHPELAIESPRTRHFMQPGKLHTTELNAPVDHASIKSWRRLILILMMQVLVLWLLLQIDL